jgi:hypothetical protein
MNLNIFKQNYKHTIIEFIWEGSREGVYQEKVFSTSLWIDQ